MELRTVGLHTLLAYLMGVDDLRYLWGLIVFQLGSIAGYWAFRAGFVQHSDGIAEDDIDYLGFAIPGFVAAALYWVLLYFVVDPATTEGGIRPDPYQAVN
jgi:hypothetical protein